MSKLHSIAIKLFQPMLSIIAICTILPACGPQKYTLGKYLGEDTDTTVKTITIISIEGGKLESLSPDGKLIMETPLDQVTERVEVYRILASEAGRPTKVENYTEKDITTSRMLMDGKLSEIAKESRLQGMTQT